MLTLLPFIHAVAELRSVQAQLVVIAANAVTLMVIALKSVFSSLYTQSHCPIIASPLPNTLCQHFHSLHAHYWHMQGKCVCACARMGENVCSVLLLGCLSMCINSAACHLHFALSLLFGNVCLSADWWHETLAKTKGNHLKIVVSRTMSSPHEPKNMLMGWLEMFFSWISSS